MNGDKKDFTADEDSESGQMRATGVSRRSALKLIAGSATSSVAGSELVSDIARADAADARELDIQDGETIDPYLEGISDGEEVKIPQGTYELNNATIAADDWRVYGQGCTIVPQGYGRLFPTGDNWQFGRVRFDTSGSNNLTVHPRGGDWTFHNCAWDGPNTGGETVDYLIEPGVKEGTTGVADTIWWGSGFGPGTSESAVKHYGKVDGEMWYKRCHFQQNGTYATESDPTMTSLGTANFEKCYAENCWHSSLRVGNEYGETCQIKDCTIVYDDPDVTRGEPTRGIWAFWGDVRVENTDILVEDQFDAAEAIATSEHDTHKSGYVDVYGGNIKGSTQNRVRLHDVGDNPSKDPPEGCPMSVEEAVGGDIDGGTSEVVEDFSHDDVPGTYSLDTGAFTTSSTRSTSDSYSIRPDDSADSDELIIRDDMVTTAGNTYELDVYHQSSTDADMGFLFGAQSATGWSDYTGYFGFFHSNADEIRLDYWENGSLSASAASAATWPLDEWVIAELDYRDSDSSTITMTVFDASGDQIASVSLSDTTYDSGSIGWYNYHAASDWYADSWFAADGGESSGTVVDDFEDGDLSEYAFDRGSSNASVVSSPTHSGSYALEYAETYTEAISTSGLNAYPAAGDTFSFWVQASGGANNLNVTWGVQDHQNRYYAKLKPNSGGFLLYTFENDSGTQEDYEGGLSLSQNAWYEIEIDWATDGTQTATLYDSGGTQLSQLSMTDATWTAGGVGYDAYLGSSEFVYFDDVTIE